MYMSDNLDQSQRFISPEKGVELFVIQAQMFPEIIDEITLLSGGSIGLVNAIMLRMGDAISEEPMLETTPARMREILGVPEEPTALPEWQSTFWDAFKQEQEARRTDLL